MSEKRSFSQAGEKTNTVAVHPWPRYTREQIRLLFHTGYQGEFPMAASTEAKIVHNVYFRLKDSSPEAMKMLVEACKKYLDGHPGTVYFAVGILAQDFQREVNDRDWDVGLHVVFGNKAAHDRYQEDPRHIQFIEENKANWKKVRVFDSAVD
jgi:Stress responsive A/B Barrel Domain